MSYQSEREQFIARMSHEGLNYHTTAKLLRIATTLQRLAELACSSEAADRDRVPCPALKGGPCLCDSAELHEKPLPPGWSPGVPRIAVQDWNATQRARAAVPDGWEIDTQGDPRGYVLRVIPPSYAERNVGRDRFNLDTIGVPARDSRLRF